jgi:hypothetical protein
MKMNGRLRVFHYRHHCRRREGTRART